MKILKIIKGIFTWLIVALAVCMMIFTIVSVNTFDRADRNIFGYKAFVVLSDSMTKTEDSGYFNAGDLILSKEVDPTTLQAGDVITYQSTNEENYGEFVTHKIRELTTDAEGHPGFITYGTYTGVDDEKVVIHDFVIGKYQMRLPGVGGFFKYVKSAPGYILFIFLPFMLLILLQGMNSMRLFRKYKKEQQEELQAERDKIEADRAETQRMMAELLEMKAKMENGGEKPETPEPANEPSSENN